jgi:hypothetical protein
MKKKNTAVFNKNEINTRTISNNTVKPIKIKKRFFRKEAGYISK